jgi:plasmid stabilization system protein ParE
MFAKYFFRKTPPYITGGDRFYFNYFNSTIVFIFDKQQTTKQTNKKMNVLNNYDECKRALLQEADAAQEDVWARAERACEALLMDHPEIANERLTVDYEKVIQDLQAQLKAQTEAMEGMTRRSNFYFDKWVRCDRELQQQLDKNTRMAQLLDESQRLLLECHEDLGTFENI